VLAQARRAAASAPSNTVVGSTPRTARDDVHLSGIALGSPSEVRYQLGLSKRLDFLASSECERLVASYGTLVRVLQTLVGSLDRRA